ncbi:MAG: hypothetical protein KatS3mg068_1125 [Candidatus Sericytochromatia bacterium]|nr:MAG: hypothetical protein KatS3mg068_1125 [Candidatus Sericytochromatia bacterium]
MSILEVFFKPKWKNKNPEVRKKSIPNIKEQSIIKDLAINDDNLEVKKVAIDYIKSQQDLLDIYNKSKDILVKKYVIKKISDENILSKILLESNDIDIKIEISKKINNQNILFDIINKSQAEDTCIICINKLNNQEMLFSIIKSNRSFDIKDASIRKINSQDLLEKIVLDKNIDERLIKNALAKITNIDFLTNYYINTNIGFLKDEALNSIIREIHKIFDINKFEHLLKNPIYEVRKNFLFKKFNNINISSLAQSIDDINIIEDIALNDKDINAREIAIKKINNIDVLSKIAKYDNDNYIKILAISKINDENILLDILKNNDLIEICELCINKISNKNILYDISINHKEYEIRKLALFKFTDIYKIEDIIKTTNEQKILLDIAKNDNDKIIREYALRFLEKQEYLSEIVLDSKFDEQKILSLSRINDINLLKNQDIQEFAYNLFKLEDDIRKKKEYLKKIVNENILVEIFKKENENIAIKISAIEKVNDLNILKDDNLQKAIKSELEKTEYNNFKYVLIDKIFDTKYLEKIILENDDFWLKNLAVKKINDLNILKKLIETDCSLKIKEIIVIKLADLGEYNLLKKLLLDTKDIEFIKILVNGIYDNNEVLKNVIESKEDPRMLEYIAKKAKDYNLRVYSLKKLYQNDDINLLVEDIQDNDILKDIVFNDENENIKLKATNKLQDIHILEDISRNHENWKVRLEAVKKVKNQKLLFDIVKNDKVIEVAKEAVKYIEENKILEELALKHENYMIRLFATNKIDNPEVLSEIAKNDTNEDVKMAAIMKINVQRTLINISRNTSSDFLKKAANEKIYEDEKNYILEDNNNKQVVSKEENNETFYEEEKFINSIPVKLINYFENKYTIIKELGRGGMGAVYLADDKNLNQQVAIKILNLSNFKDDEETIKEVIYSFKREAIAISNLNHKNIVNIYDVGQIDKYTHYIVMELLKGKAVSKLIEEKTLTLEKILNIIVQISEALDYIHQNNIVHRDIKPENIMYDEDTNTAKLTDFGIAKFLNSKPINTSDGNLVGTILYISPEQLQNPENVDGRSDQFSFGVSLYQIFTGKLPIDGDNIRDIIMKIVSELPPPPSIYNSSIPKKLDEIILKTLQKDRIDRFRKMSDLVEELKYIKEFESFFNKENLDSKRKISKKLDDYQEHLDFSWLDKL